MEMNLNLNLNDVYCALHKELVNSMKNLDEEAFIKSLVESGKVTINLAVSLDAVSFHSLLREHQSKEEKENGQLS